jgi:hypothetical protein
VPGNSPVEKLGRLGVRRPAAAVAMWPVGHDAVSGRDVVTTGDGAHRGRGRRP